MRLAPTAGHAARGMSRGLVLRGIVLGLVLLAAWQLRQLQQLQRLEQQQQQLQLQPTAAAAVAAAAVLQPLQPASGQAESLVLSVEQLPRGLPGGPKVRVRVRVRVTVTVVRVRVTLVRVTRWASDPHLRVKVTLTLKPSPGPCLPHLRAGVGGRATRQLGAARAAAAPARARRRDGYLGALALRRAAGAQSPTLTLTVN